jgi:hypothetical protein
MVLFYRRSKLVSNKVDEISSPCSKGEGKLCNPRACSEAGVG